MAIDERAREVAQVKNILNALILLAGHLRLYGPRNRMVDLTSSRLQLLLDDFFRGQPLLQLGVARHGFLYQGEFLERSNHNYERFAAQLFMHGIASLAVGNGVSGDEVHTLLQVVNRKAAETWDEGGVVRSLAARSLSHIAVTELSERALQLVDEAEGGAGGRSTLWDRFALAQQALLGGEGEELAPEELAQRFNAVGGGEEGSQLVQLASEFLLSMQHENVRIYRTQALAKLTLFIAHLTPELRRHFLQNTFNLKLRADFAEGFYSALSDEMILDCLHDASLGGRYVPPVILTLLGKLAAERGLSEEGPVPVGAEAAESLAQRTRMILRPDAFEEFVPERYRQALLAVVRSGRLQGETEVAVENLKGTLQADAVEEHLGAVLLAILRENPDLQQLQGLRSGLEKVVQGYLDSRDYVALCQLQSSCAVSGGSDALAPLFQSPVFVRSLLGTLPGAGKEQYEPIRQLLLAIGAAAVVPLLDHLAQENNRTLRHFCIETLKGLGRGVSLAVLGRLEDKRWYVLRNLLYLLRELDEPDVLPQLRPFVRHGHPKVREEALKACLHFRDPVAEGVLLEELTAKERERVLAAVLLARLSRSDRVLAQLLELLNRSSLFGYDLELKRKLVQCLAFLGRVQALPALRRQLESRSLLHGDQHEQLKVEIVKALGYFPLAHARPLLQRLAGSGSEELQRIAQGVLERGGGTG